MDTSKYGTNYFIITTVLQMRRLWNLCRRVCWYPPSRLNHAETRSITLIGISKVHYMGLKSKVYLPELLEPVSAGEVLEADINLSSCINFTVSSFVIAYTVIIKTLVAYLDVILLFVSQTSTFDSPSSIYSKMFGFIRYDFRCFGAKD